MSDKKEDFNTAIMDKKKAPNRLVVDDALNDDNSVVCLSPAKMEELNLFRGDTVLLKGKKGRDTLCVVLANEETDDANVRMNKVYPLKKLIFFADFNEILFYRSFVRTSEFVLVILLPSPLKKMFNIARKFTSFHSMTPLKAFPEISLMHT